MLVLQRLPSLNYPVTRSFPWWWFTPFAYGIVLMGIAFLIPINYTLTGFQIVAQLDDNYNVTQPRWFEHYVPSGLRQFIPRPRAGSICDPHVFAVGDTFFTNYTIFKWTIDATWNETTVNNVGSGVAYKSQVLNSCDVERITLAANLRALSVSISADIACVDPDFYVAATTDFVSSYVTQSASITSGQSVWKSIAPSGVGTVAGAVNEYIQLAGMDLILNMIAVINANNTAPVLLSAGAYPTFCPQTAMGLPNFPNCTKETNEGVPNLNIGIDTIGRSDWNLETETLNDVNETYAPFYYTALSNIMQAMHAAVRLDVGNDFQSNIFINTSAIPNTLISDIPQSWSLVNGVLTPGTTQVTNLYDGLTIAGGWKINGDNVLQPPMNGGPDSIISVPYLCHFSIPKSPGQIFISVLVATLSMFTSGWGALMAGAAIFAKRHEPTANHCGNHRVPEVNYHTVVYPGGDDEEKGKSLLYQD